MIRVWLPAHLRTLARVGSEVTVEVDGRATLRSVLDALEARYPVLRGTLRDHITLERRPYVRFSPASKICRSTHPTPRSPMRSQRAPSHC